MKNWIVMVSAIEREDIARTERFCQEERCKGRKGGFACLFAAMGKEKFHEEPKVG